MRPHKNKVVTIPNWQLIFLRDGHCFRCRFGLARQGRLHAFQSGHSQQSRIGRNDIASLEMDDISGNNFDGRNHDNRPVTSYFSLWSCHFFQRCNRTLGRPFLVKAHDCVQRNNGKDGHGVHRVSHKTRYKSSRDQNPNQQRLKLPKKDGQGTDALGFSQCIRAISGKSGLGFVRCQPSGGGIDLKQHCFRCILIPLFSRAFVIGLADIVRQGGSLQSSGVLQRLLLTV